MKHYETSVEFPTGGVQEVEMQSSPIVDLGEQKSSTLDAMVPAFDMSSGEEEFTLPSGKKCSSVKFKGKHVFAAQERMAELPESQKKSSMLVPLIISMLVKIEGKPIPVEDLFEMDGADTLDLLGKFSAANFR